MSAEKHEKEQRPSTLLRLLAATGINVEDGTIHYQPQRLRQRIARLWPEVLFLHETTRPVVALTIDDGPHPMLTPQILDVLGEFQAHATFFMLTDRVKGHEEIVKRVVGEGHELGNHLCYDAPSIRLPPAEFVRQLESAHRVLSTFAPVTWFRPGSGWFNQRILTELKQHDYRCALASVYPYDAQFPYPILVSNYILRNIFPGAIIVLHEGTWARRGTIRVLRTVLPSIKQQGYQVLTLSELVALPTS